MADLTRYSTEGVEPSKAFDLLPSGKYRAMIVDSSMEQTKDKKGEYLKLEFQIIEDGPAQNRKLWTNLNLDNPSEKAMEIAYRDLAAIKLAINVPNPKDSQELHDKPLIIKIGIQRGKDGYEDQNTIKGYFPDAGPAGATPAAATAATQAAPTQTAAAPAANTPPWKR